MISQRGLDLIKAHEGLRLNAYPDPASGGDPWTIGYGHTQGVQRGQTITKEQAEAFLREDLAWVEDAIRQNVKVPLNENKHDALASLIFNIGAGAFKDSTLLRKLNAGDYEGAGQEFIRWNKAAGSVNAGLTNRRQKEAALFNAPAPIETRDLPKEATMPAPIGFLWGLASTLIDVFAPLAKEKVSKEMGRHTDNPEVANRIAQGVIDTAKALTGQADPVAAVVAAKADPAIVEQIQTSVLDDLDRLAPVLDKLSQWDTQAWQSEEDSRDRAAARALSARTDQDPFLTRSIIWMMVGLLIVGALLIAGLAWLGKDVQTLIGFWITIAGAVGAKFGTRYDHQYGSSRSSGAKDVVMAELSRRPMPK